MNKQLYLDLVAYLETGDFPKVFTSTKANFKKLAGKHSLNQKGTLFRGGKIVVKKSERKKIYEGKIVATKFRLSVPPAFRKRSHLEQN